MTRITTAPLDHEALVKTLDISGIGAVATHLARGAALKDAVTAVKAYVEGAMRHGIPLGKGHRPLNHFWRAPRI